MVVLTVGFRRISLKLFYVKVLTVTACIQTNERCCISPSFIIFIIVLILCTLLWLQYHIQWFYFISRYL